MWVFVWVDDRSIDFNPTLGLILTLDELMLLEWLKDFNPTLGLILTQPSA